MPLSCTTRFTSASDSGPSSETASTTKPLSLRVLYSSMRCGISAMHGSQVVDQKSISTTLLPRYSERRTVRPSVDGSEKSGAAARAPGAEEPSAPHEHNAAHAITIARRRDRSITDGPTV